MTYPCRICNVPGHVTTSLHEPCPTCRREIADWDPPHPSTDPYDKVQDARAEAAHDGIDLSTADVIRLTLAFEETHDYYRKLSPAARHPFGLPTVDPAPPSPAAVVDIPRPSDRRLSSATGQTGRGHQLPDLPSAA